MLAELLRTMSPWELLLAVVDIGLVAYVFYRFFVLIRGTRAVQLIKGIMVLLLANAAARLLNLNTIYWLLDRMLLLGAVALPVVFQPELRRALEQIGRGRLFAKAAQLGEEELRQVVDNVVRACEVLSRTNTGALMVFEMETGLGDLIDAGIKVDGLVTTQLLTNVFVPNTPLHDGAVILRGNRVAAAGCFLPLAESADLPPELGSRHRAAIGVTEQSDAVAVVVSEETGTISIAQGGKLHRYLDERSLRELLTGWLVPKNGNNFTLWNWRTH